MQNRNAGFDFVNTMIESAIVSAGSTSAFANVFGNLDLSNMKELGVDTTVLTELVKAGCIITSSMITGNLWATQNSFFASYPQFIMSNAYSFATVAGSYITSKGIEAVLDVNPSFAFLIGSSAICGSTFLVKLYFNQMEQSVRNTARFSHDV